MSEPVRTYAPTAQTVRCWLCGTGLAVRRTKTDQPYMSCIECGLQMFVRSTAGAERLMAQCVETARDEEAEGGLSR